MKSTGHEGKEEVKCPHLENCCVKRRRRRRRKNVHGSRGEKEGKEGRSEKQTNLD